VTPRDRGDLLFIVGAVLAGALIGLAIYLFWPV
jgi:hypothetical protein